MSAALILALALAAPPAAEWQGSVRVVRGAPGASGQVLLVMGDRSTHALAGAATAELARLQSVIVAVRGDKEAAGIVVQSYEIIDVGGGARPHVGILEASAGGQLSLRTEDGSPVALNPTRRTRERLQAQIGAKLWVYGKSDAGQLKVLRFGLLKEKAPKSNPGQ